MEEVVGSIPTRSTKYHNNLNGARLVEFAICVVVCDVTRQSCACRKRFHGRALGFHADMAIPLQHASADVPGNGHDGRIGCSALGKLGNGAVSEVMETESCQSGFFRQRPPSCPPAFHMPRRVKGGDVVVDYFFAAERERVVM